MRLHQNGAMSDIEAAREYSESTQRIGELEEALRRARRQLHDAKRGWEQVVEAVYQGAHDARLSLGERKPVKAPAKDKRMRGEHVNLMDLGDWQASKITTSYDTKVLTHRLGIYRDKAEYFLREQQNSRPVRHAVMILGGDMIEGWWNFPRQPGEVEMEPVDQVVYVADEIVKMVTWALSVHEHVTVIAEPGNHGRIGSKRDNVRHSTNFDRMAFILAIRDLRADIESGRLIFDDPGERDIQTLEVGAYRALVLHGDEIGRNGYASPQSILRHVDRWKSGSFRVDGVKWPFRDVYVHHYHQLMEMTTADGEGRVFFNGSTESDNRYAMEQMAAAGLPTQRQHFIDPSRGLVVQRIDILLED